jgi:serine/threonine protein kinase
VTHPHDALTTGAPEALPESPPDVGKDGRLGPYRLIREIGHGGMGTVYLGVRDDDAFQKRVAIKVLRRGMDTDSIVRRFRTSGRSSPASSIRISPACSTAAARRTAGRTSRWSSSKGSRSSSTATTHGLDTPRA